MQSASSRLAVVAALVLGMGIASQAVAADLAASTAKDIRTSLTAAFITATTATTEVEGLVGKKAPDSLKRGLKVVDDAAAAAERLANGDPNLQPGLSHVRTNTAKILANGKVDKQAVSLMHESVAELHALIVNACILEAVGYLHNAAGALRKNDAAGVTLYLQEAEQALQDAAERGGYHIENDIEALQASLKDIADRVGHKVPVDPGAIDERIMEVKAHLFELGGEQ